MPTEIAALLDRIRAQCLSYPEVSERESHGVPTFFVREKRSFLNLVPRYHYGDGRPALICAAPEGAQAEIVESDPDLYFLPKYVAKQGWIGMWLDRGAPFEVVSSHAALAYETAAEKLAPRKAKKSPREKVSKKPPRSRA
jgi:hypothetical protein